MHCCAQIKAPVKKCWGFSHCVDKVRFPAVTNLTPDVKAQSTWWFHDKTKSPGRIGWPGLSQGPNSQAPAPEKAVAHGCNQDVHLLRVNDSQTTTHNENPGQHCN
jgi:hypothetical protein